MDVGRSPVPYLQAARALRSVGQGVAIVDMALYLKEIGWRATAIGGVMSAAGVAGALLILVVGVASDRVGRKPFLFAYECMTCLAAFVVAVSRNPVALAAAIIATGFGRGQNGAAGPFTPAEQAWMAQSVGRDRRSRVFSINTAIGFFGMALGCVLGGLDRMWRHALPGAAAFRPLFTGIALLSLLCACVVWLAPGGGRTRAEQREGGKRSDNADQSGAVAPGEALDGTSKRREENRNIAKFAFVNLLNGLGVGFVGPMMSYWFAVRFGATSAQIGGTMALSFVVTGLSAILSGYLADRVGMVRSVVWLRLLGVALMVVLPLMPTFALASAVYAVRGALSRGTQGVRSALGSSFTGDERRGFSLSMNSFFTRVASAVGPTVSGWLLDAGSFALPFFFAGALQLASTVLYGLFFRSFDGGPGRRR
ncbi:MFS transporter [Alicyclobacillus vulcanalis]|uniref:Predicted arabinose efflux permease, MFS family n=1 Tax=Alicyclobacillus vulcanalis TaxID=252246 RepID=A0A1N7K9S4_9BACL|nr:MFS transporter [Alicyclobacillus vulcanalis]SIS58333.1 Predicted arabinose efflux permease, MFS family [Alicyclobacillus vulcanalis]